MSSVGCVEARMLVRFRDQHLVSIVGLHETESHDRKKEIDAQHCQRIGKASRNAPSGRQITIAGTSAATAK
jgi:hypothetical protein